MADNSLATNIGLAVHSIEQIAEAIAYMGVPVSGGTPAMEYPDLIKQISGNPPVERTEPIEVRYILPVKQKGSYVFKTEYYNYGDSVLAFPSAPLIDGLTFTRYTHALANLENLQHDIDVGLLYSPADGKTHIFTNLTTDAQLYTMTLTPATGLTVGVDWGDGSYEEFTTGGTRSHTYAEEACYEIKIGLVSGTGTYAILVYGSGTFRNKIRRIDVGRDGVISSTINSPSLEEYILGAARWSNAAWNLVSPSLKSWIIPDNYPTGNVTLSGFACLRYIVAEQAYGGSAISGGNNVYSVEKYTTMPAQTSIPAAFLQNDASLIFLSVGANVLSLGAGAFTACYNLQKIIFTADSPPTVNTNTFPAVGMYRIYVPDASVDAYKEATNWVAYANRIFPLSEIKQ